MKISKLALSLVVASSLYGAPQSIDYCTGILNTYTKLYETNHSRIAQYEADIIKYQKLADSNTGFAKTLYQNSVLTTQKLLDSTKANDKVYKGYVDTWTQKLNESIAYYSPKTIDAPTQKVTSIIPLTTSQEYKNSKVYDSIGVSVPWSQGYTGKGVTIADVGTGISVLNTDVNRFLTKDNVIDIGSQRDSNGLSYRRIISNGAISDITLKSISGVTKKTYTTAPTVVIEGNGTGAKAIAKLDSSGNVSLILMTSFGENYSGDITVKLVDGNGVVDTTVNTSALLAGVDYNGHGTAVASLMVGAYDNNNIVGVAYDANLIVVKAGDSGISPLDALDGARLAAQKGATIINQSFGSGKTYTPLKVEYINAYKEMLASNVSFVTAAGNEGFDCKTVEQCNQYALVPTLIGKDRNNLPGAYIVAGALNSSNTDIASYSNKAGLTKDYYILAPGSVGVDALGNTITSNEGTSFAAPIVSGSMALLQQKWPRLSGAQQAQILFRTADDMGVAGVDDIYGWGKLNLSKAFSPVGDLVVSNGITNVAGLDKKVAMKAVTTTVTGSSLVTAKLASFNQLDQTVAFDEFNRDYQINVTSTVQTTLPTFSFNQFSEIPLNKDWSIGINNTFNSPSISYKFDKNKVSYSMIDGYFGTTGSGMLGFSGKTHYVGYNRNSISSDMTGVDFGVTLGYAIAENDSTSNIRMTDSTSLGVSLKAVYNGFGVVGYVPGYITSGRMIGNIPTSSDIDGNIEYTKINESMSSNDFERTIGVGYFTKNMSLTFEKTANQYNITGLDSNNVRMNASWNW